MDPDYTTNCHIFVIWLTTFVSVWRVKRQKKRVTIHQSGWMLCVMHLVSCPHLSLRRTVYRNGKLKGLSKEQHGKYSLESERSCTTNTTSISHFQHAA